MDFATEEAFTLYCHATQDAGCYQAWLLPAQQNLERKWRNGTFQRLLAIRLLTRYTLVSIAKNYRLEKGSMTNSWALMFPPHVRQEVAHYLTEELVSRLERGDSFLPSKP